MSKRVSDINEYKKKKKNNNIKRKKFLKKFWGFSFCFYFRDDNREHIRSSINI